MRSDSLDTKRDEGNNSVSYITFKQKVYSPWIPCLVT